MTPSPRPRNASRRRRLSGFGWLPILLLLQACALGSPSPPAPDTFCLNYRPILTTVEERNATPVRAMDQIDGDNAVWNALCSAIIK